ncbi:hypothetical protein A3K86_02660 [Photobacterium jeanii]|uniref:Uncharacterized protein n=1 Tax=Photobacterium jeanii TaxID=858640 RepID=A0A178KKJ1_9GAMM|nr:hypothetical protein [Photobacterium jeanii]OAN17839.1 hypothetical protein A3K86_02660 [Photobacterium jeanii]PST92495.1 hypothetical protein C9I91_04810 [Photobacterium jeanii]
MPATKHIDKTITSISYIPGLSAHAATFMASRSREREFLPSHGAHWWYISFKNPVALEKFIAELYQHGFYGDIQIRGNDVELQTRNASEVEVVNAYCHPEAFPLMVSQLSADVIYVANDSHALICNQNHNGALSYTGERLTHFQFKASPSSWALLNSLANIISIHDIVHFDPEGYMILKLEEQAEEKVIKHLEAFA